MTANLSEFRRMAAEESRGISAGPIYDRVCEVLAKEGAKGAALDFGAGVGSLTARLLELGRFQSCVGADLVGRPASLDTAVGWIEGDLNERLDVPDGSFDTVVACEVIEHLENPRGLAREWRRILRPGGLLVVSTPNNESWRSIVALVARGHFVAFGATSYPAHITALVRLDVERILTEAGFTGIGFGYTDAGGIPGRPATTWQSISGGLLRGRRWSDGLVAWARRPG